MEVKLSKDHMIEGQIIGKGNSLIIEAEADIAKMIKDLGGDFGGDNESQMKGVQLLKGLATSDDPKANEFMKKLNKATTDISKELTK